jgi:hypothetical protein
MKKKLLLLFLVFTFLFCGKSENNAPQSLVGKTINCSAHRKFVSDGGGFYSINFISETKVKFNEPQEMGEPKIYEENYKINGSAILIGKDVYTMVDNKYFRSDADAKLYTNDKKIIEKISAAHDNSAKGAEPTAEEKSLPDEIFFCE